MIVKIAKVTSLWAILGTLTLLPVASLADTVNKIALVDARIAIMASRTAQTYIKAFEESADFLSLKAKLESSTADFQAMGQEAETQRLTWSAEQLAEHQKKMSYVKADAELAIQKISAEQKQLEQRILQNLAPLVEQSIQEIVKEQGITLLLRAESVLLASPETSITQQVAKRIDIKSQPKAE